MVAEIKKVIHMGKRGTKLNEEDWQTLKGNNINKATEQYMEKLTKYSKTTTKYIEYAEEENL